MMAHKIRRQLIAEAARDRAVREMRKMICWVLAGFVGAFIIAVLYHAN